MSEDSRSVVAVDDGWNGRVRLADHGPAWAVGATYAKQLPPLLGRRSA